MNSDHWDRIYTHKRPDEMSWHTENLSLSQSLVTRYSVPSQRVIDIGGGISPLPKALIALGYTRLAVADISRQALDRAASALGSQSTPVEWLCVDVAAGDLDLGPVDVWHDRAVMHFLVDP